MVEIWGMGTRTDLDCLGRQWDDLPYLSSSHLPVSPCQQVPGRDFTLAMSHDEPPLVFILPAVNLGRDLRPNPSNRT